MSIDSVSTRSTSIRTARPAAVRPNPLPRALLRLALPAAAITLALAVEVSVLPRLRLPYAVPDLMVLVVIGFAAAWGATGGAVIGFAAGLVLDLAPPSVNPIGWHALVLTCVGAMAGRAGRQVGKSALRTCLLAGVYAAVVVAADALIAAVLGDGAGLTRPGLAAAIGATALYTAVATPLVVPGVAALARRTRSPGARVLAPTGDALRQPPSTGVYGTFDGVVFRGPVEPRSRSGSGSAGSGSAGSGSAGSASGGSPSGGEGVTVLPGAPAAPLTPVVLCAPDPRPPHATAVHPAHDPSDHVHADHPHADHLHPDHIHVDPSHPGHTHPAAAHPDGPHPAHDPRDPAAPDPAPRGARRAVQNPEAG